MLTKEALRKGGLDADGQMPNIFRLQVELDADFSDEIGQLQILGGLRTKKDVVENALAAFMWAAREKAHGAAIVAVDPVAGTYSELQMPVLEIIASKGAKRRGEKASGWRTVLPQPEATRRGAAHDATGPRPVARRRR